MKGESVGVIIMNNIYDNVNETAMNSGQGVRSIIRQLEMLLIDHESEQPWVMPSMRCMKTDFIDWRF